MRPLTSLVAATSIHKRQLLSQSTAEGFPNWSLSQVNKEHVQLHRTCIKTIHNSRQIQSEDRTRTLVPCCYESHAVLLLWPNGIKSDRNQFTENKSGVLYSARHRCGPSQPQENSFLQSVQCRAFRVSYTP